MGILGNTFLEAFCVTFITSSLADKMLQMIVAHYVHLDKNKFSQPVLSSYDTYEFLKSL